MKKLTALLLTIATGLFAFGVDTGFKFSRTTFEPGEGYVAGTTISNATQEASGWYWFLAAGADEESGTVKADKDNDGNITNQYLEVETGAVPLYRTISNKTSAATMTFDQLKQVDIGSGIFFDAKVKFTPSAESPTLADGDKFAVWAYEQEDGEGNLSTNLMVTAGSRVSSGGVITTNFTLKVDSDFDYSAWHRLTIRSLNEVSADEDMVSGFLVFLDRDGESELPPVAVADTEDYTGMIGCSESDISTGVKKYFTNKQLFLSAGDAGKITNQKLQVIGLQGSGAIDDLQITDYENAPGFARGTVQVAVNYTVGDVTGFEIWANGNTKVPDEKITKVDGTWTAEVDGMTSKIVVKNIATATGKMVVNYTDSEDKTIEFPAETGGTIETATIGFVVDGVNYKEGATGFNDALKAGASGDIIKLATGFKMDMDEDYTSGLYLDTGNYVIDLAGKTFEVFGSVTGYESAAFDIADNAKLLVYDSVGGGIMKATGFDAALICAESEGAFMLGAETGDQGAKIKGTIEDGGNPANVFLYNGYVSETDNPDVDDSGWVAPGRAAKPGTGDYTGFWVIAQATSFAVTVPEIPSDAHVSFESIKYDGQQDANDPTAGVYVVETSLVVKYKLDDHYELAAGSQPLEQSFTAAGTATTPTAQPMSYEVKFEDAADNSATIAPPAGTSNLVYETEVAITVTPKTGYEYTTAPDGWTLTGGNLTSNLTVVAATTVTAPSATQKGYTLALTPGANTTLTADPAGPYYHYGDTVKLTATLKPNYKFGALTEGWALDENGAATNTITIVDGTNAVTGPAAELDTVTFTIKDITGATVDKVYTNGTDWVELTGSAPYTVLRGAQVKITYTAAEGYELTASAYVMDALTEDSTEIDPTETIKPMPYVAQIVVSGTETNKYTSLSAAFAAVEDGQTIEMIADYTIPAAITVEKATTEGITLDLGGKTLTPGVNVSYALKVMGATTKLTITNGVYASVTDNALRAESGATVTIAVGTTITGNQPVQANAAAILNVYGVISLGDAIISYGSTVNVYDDAIIGLAGSGTTGVYLWASGAQAPTINVIGGKIVAATAVSGSDTAVVNLFGGVIDGYLDGCPALYGTVTDECKTLFKAINCEASHKGVDALCATGYEPVKVGGEGEYKDYYQIVIKKFDVTFKNGDAVYATSNAVPYGTAFADVKPEDPTAPAGKSFKCWEPESETTIVSNTTYTAAFTNNLYALTLTAGDNTQIAADPDKDLYEFGETVVITATPDEHYEFTSFTDPWFEAENGAATNTHTIVVGENPVAGPAATPKPVAITIPTATDIEGVSSLVISQKVGGVWEEVTNGKIGVPNDWAVYAIVEVGKTVSNPVTNGAAAVGAPIVVSADDIKSKIGIQTFTVEVPAADHTTVAVYTNEATEAAYAVADTYTLDYGTKVRVVYAPSPAEGYKITANAETNIDSLVENVTVTAPTVEILKFTVTFMNGTETYGVSNNVPWGTAFSDVKPTTDPTTDGKTFLGWEPQSEATIVSNTTYTATFADKVYELKLTAGANTEIAKNPTKDNFLLGETVVITATPNEHYKFAELPDDWYRSDNGTATNTYTIIDGENEVTGPDAVLDTVTFTVKAIPGAKVDKVYTNDGASAWVELTGDYTVIRGALVKVTFEPDGEYQLTATEYVTDALMDDSTEIDAAETIKPIALYTVTFKVEDQADYVTNSIPSNTEFAVIRPADPTAPTGQSFKCWEPVEEFVVSNTTYTAAFTNNFYDITFKNADGTWNKVVSTEYNVMPVAPTAPDVTGHSFKEWNPAVVVAVAPATYTAVYTANVYAVTFANGENSTINPTAGTVGYDYGTALEIVATADANYEFAAASYEGGWLKTDDCTKLTNSYVVTGEKTFTAPAATPAPVTITIPSAVDGVSSLVISQNVGGVWEEVTGDPKKIAVGNEWAVYATVVEGKTVLNPVATGTAAVGTAIEVTADDIKAKIGIQTFTVEVTLPENAMVAVITNDATEAEAGTTAATYTFDYGTKVDVVYTPNEGYHITANAETNIASLVADVVVTAPTVEINTYDITFTDAAAWTNVVPTTHGATPAPTENIPEVEGHSFSDWTPTVAAAVAPATYTAVYTANVYAVTFANGANSTITPTAGTQYYDYGTALAITATAEEDYEFAAESYSDGWLKTDDCTKLTNSYVVTGEKTFTAPDATAISYAAWIKVGESGAVQKFRNYDEALAAVQEAEQAGTYPISVMIKSATDAFAADTRIEITAGGWTITGDAVLTNDVDVVEGKTVEVSGALTYSGKVSGTLKAASLTIPSGGAITIDTNGTVTVTGTTTLTADSFTAVDGYKVIKSVGEGVVTFTVTKLHTATFMVDTETIEKLEYTINDSTETNEYTEAITGLITGDKITLVVTPTTGYEYKGETEFIVANVDINAEISAKNQTYDITFKIGETSIVSNAVPYSTLFEDVVPEVTAPEGKSLKGWTPEVTMIDGKTLEFTAQFTNNFYTLTLTDGAKGSISSTPAAGLVEYGTAVKVTVTPDAGYQFDPIPEGWTAGDNGTIVSNFTMAAGNVAITAPDAVVIKTGFAIIIAGDTPTTNYYPTLAAAIEAAGTGEPALPGVVTLLEDATLTETLTITKAVTLDLNDTTMTFANNLTAGIKITADGVEIKNGKIASSLTANVLQSKAIEVAHANVTLTDVEIDAAHYEYAIYANCDEACGNDLAWFYTQQDFKTLTCDGVAISGNGSLFHVEGMVATLTDCSAIADGNELFANEAHRAAVYSSVNARTTIKGSGTYTHEKALLSGNLGGKITVDTASTAAFTGQIYSWMQADAHDDLEQYADYKATYVLNGGTYDCTVAFKEDGARDLDSFTKNSLIEIPAPEGYIWYNDITLGKPIVATFMVDDAVYAAETNIVAFTPATPTAPTKEGKSFEGWSPAIAEISASQEFTAQFADLYYNVTFADAADGSATITPAAGTSNLVWGTELEITAKAVDGYEFVGDTGWAVVDAATVKTNYTVTAAATFTAPQAVSSTITVNVTWDGSIAGVKANGGDVVAGAVEFPRTTTEVAFELTTALKVPVYTVTIDGVAAVTNKAPVLAVTNGMAIAFSAEEAKEDDVTEDQAKGALVDAGMSGEKLAAITTDDEVTAKKVATWAAKQDDVAEALSGDYVGASVKLDVDPIETNTTVEVVSVDADEGLLKVTIKVAGADVTKEEIEGYVWLCGSLGGGEEPSWVTLPTAVKLQQAVTIEGNKLVITPQEGIDQLFLKVIIPKDAK